MNSRPKKYKFVQQLKKKNNTKILQGLCVWNSEQTDHIAQVRLESKITLKSLLKEFFPKIQKKVF